VDKKSGNVQEKRLRAENMRLRRELAQVRSVRLASSAAVDPSGSSPSSGQCHQHLLCGPETCYANRIMRGHAAVIYQYLAIAAVLLNWSGSKHAAAISKTSVALFLGLEQACDNVLRVWCEPQVADGRQPPQRRSNAS